MLPIARSTEDRASQLLTTQWDNSPKVQGLLKSFAENLHLVEDVFFQLLNERGISTAIGEQLDVLGRLTGELRYGRGDDRYRLAIGNRANINRSNGTAPELLSFLSGLTATNNVKLWEHLSGDIHLFTDSNPSPFVAHALKDAASAGIHVRLMFDILGDSFVPVEVGLAESTLVNEAISDIEVVDATGTVYSLGVSSGSSEESDYGFLPEVFERGVGTQSIVNPELDTDTTWVKGTGWAIGAGTGNKTAGVASSLEQPQTLTTDSNKVVSFTVSGRTAGSITPKFTGGVEVAGTAISSNITSTEILIVSAGTTTFELVADSAFDGSVDNIAIFTEVSTPTNPLCDIIDNSVSILEILKIVNESGDFIVNEFDDNVIGI